MLVYMLVNKVSGKVYIGQTAVSLKNRMCQHFADARRGVPILLYNAIRKYGEHNFDGVAIGIAENLKELDALEKQLILAWDSTNRSLGYNIRDGGQGGGRYEGYWHHTDEAKAKIGAASKGNKYRLGTHTHHSEETRRKISLGAQGSKHGRSKLTEDQVREIRKLDTGEWGIRGKLAKQFDVGPQIISFILNRRNWKHI
jgi:group I intron endonuclease